MKQKTLSNKERECLYLVALGKTTSEIAKTLNLSPHTVSFHIRNIFAKLNVKSRPAAIAQALTQSLLPLHDLAQCKNGPCPLLQSVSSHELSNRLSETHKLAIEPNRNHGVSY